jgi:hypothetical protein
MHAMTRAEQDAIAAAIKTAHHYDGKIADTASAGTAQRAVSRLAQSIADTLNRNSRKFDRKRFVENCGFGHLENF